VHGCAANAHWFDYVAADLREAFHVQALELRGHGDSDWGPAADYGYRRYADDLNEAVAALGLERFCLIGHSMGGMVSVVYAATYPGKLQKLVVVDSLLRMTADRVANFHGIGAREGSRHASEEEYVRRYRRRPVGTRAPGEVLANLARHGGRADPDGMWRHKFDRNIYATREPLDGVPLWERIDIPALLVKGESSARISPQIVADIRTRAPQVELAEVPQADHHIMLDNPAGFVAAVQPFLLRS
jgi:pimeloyl-ACP methyl ester carboxylesterase